MHSTIIFAVTFRPLLFSASTHQPFTTLAIKEREKAEKKKDQKQAFNEKKTLFPFAVHRPLKSLRSINITKTQTTGTDSRHKHTHPQKEIEGEKKRTRVCFSLSVCVCQMHSALTQKKRGKKGKIRQRCLDSHAFFSSFRQKLDKEVAKSNHSSSRKKNKYFKSL